MLFIFHSLKDTFMFIGGIKMKRGYERLLVYSAFIFLFLFINLFVFNFLSGMKISLFLIFVLYLFKYLFGFERDNHRYIKDFIMDEIIFLIIFFLLYYLSGLIFGFAKTDYLNYDGLIRFILPTICYTILRELFRYMALTKSGNNKFLIVLITLLIIFMDISESYFYTNLSGNYNSFIYFAIFLLPAVSNNIVYSYITTKIGYKPLIVYGLIIGLYPYLLPIVPNPSEYIHAMVLFLLPVVFGYRAYKFFGKMKNEKLERDYYKNKNSLKGFLVVSVIVIILVYFISGYFEYWAISIASGSMSKAINKGDIVIIHKIDDGYDKLDVGQVLAYEYRGNVIVHRIVDKIKLDDKYYFSTKGDANLTVDNIIIEEDMIVGVVNFKIPFLGLPTVWLNEL